MEARDYAPHVITSSSTSYPSPLAHSPHLPQQDSTAQVLPPILQTQQGQNMQQSMYGGGHPHTPRTPATPNTPGSAASIPSYSQPASTQAAGRPAMYSMAQTSQYPAPHGYGASSSMMPQATTAASHPQPIAPAPASTRTAPVLRPMPTGGMMNQSLMPGPMLQHSPGLQEAEPTHVVGSQGRRGILPSAPGRPQVGHGNNKGTLVPQKDADGKFPCPHCTKTYLHAKHLKRHLLRHTGDRPYRCVLCHDTFSRSDILKRHFQKCSIRRGNPTGASHLSHPQAHVKKSAPPQKTLGAEGDMGHLNGLGNLQGDGMVHPFGMVPVSDGLPNLANDQRSVMGTSSRGGSYEQQYGGDVSNSMTSQQMSNYNMPTGQNGMPMYSGGGSNEWAQMFPTGAQDTYASTFTPNIGQTQTGVKQEPNTDSGRTDGSAGGSTDTNSLFFANYEIPTTHSDPYLFLSNQILEFFYPPDTMITTQSAGMNLYFSPENIKDFLDKYTHFHIHFPMLHIPTFRIMDSYTGLLAGLCCIGACYSDRVQACHIREMMTFLKAALERDSQVLAMIQQGRSHLGRSLTKNDIEEMQAIMLMTMLHLWNGTPQQRDESRQLYPVLSACVRNLGLLRVSADSALFSPLHQQGFTPGSFEVSRFEWDSWVEQETRIRLAHIILVGDIAMALYFNMTPEFDSFEMTLPLPSDDGAWDAKSANDCAIALGLFGADAARDKNPDGTQRAKQPETDLALRALLHESYQIQPGSTNLYGKFILIHHILSLIRKALVDRNPSVFGDLGTPPLSDWIVPGGDTSNGGRLTPVEGAAQQIDPHTLRSLCTALDKFKSNWDIDMATQFPPSIWKNPRRYGFSRDGIHFYWLAKYMLKYTRPAELQMAPDSRFMVVMQLLKSVKAWVMSDGASRGEELGSVGEIDKDYGVTDLTLNMADLFKPLPKLVDDPRIPSVKTDIGQNGTDMI